MDNEQKRLREDVEQTVPYLVYESAQARSERTIKRLIIVLIMTILLLFLSNAYWVYEWGQYEYEDYYYDQSGEGLNSINFGTQGDLRNEPKIDYTQETETEAGE